MKAQSLQLIEERPATSVTDRTGHIGYTFSPFGRKVDAVEGVFGHG